MPISNILCYQMLGATPSHNTDTILGTATYLGGGSFTFNLPPIASDIKIYMVAFDKAGNSSYSFIAPYWNGTDAIQVRGAGGVALGALGLRQGGLIKQRI